MHLRGLTSALALAVVGLTATSCNWQDVDKDSQNTPVLSLGAPDKFGTKDDFGRIVIPITAPSENDGVAGRFLVSGATGTALALVELDAAGKSTTTNISSPAFSGPNMTDGFPLNAIAEIPGPKPGKVLAAAKAIRDGSTVIYTATLGGTFDGTVVLATDTEAWLGIGVAAGDLKVGDATLPEYVVASPDFIHVYVDGKADGALTWPAAVGGTDCPVSLPGGSDPNKIPLSRPILIGHFWGEGTDPQIAFSTFGSFGAATKGSVSFLSVSAAGLSCLGTLPGAEEDFGQSLGVGDFNGDLKPDLIVGAPPLKAYVYIGPLAGTSPGIVLPSDPAVATQFGAAVGSINLDGAGMDMAIVGDPSAPVSGSSQAGTAQLFSFGGSKATPTVTTGMLLAAHDPAANAAYGSSVTGLPFCGTCATGSAPRIPVVGAGGRVLTYFTLGKTDLRMKP
ncbi:MAG TPA: FG-GAP repeat protein [Polyangia bacterium]|jgi:hypothetical protein